MPNLWFNTYMMHDSIALEETITPDIAAEIEHREWERGNEERERWEALEAIHGPFLKPDEAALVRRTAEYVATVTG